MYTTCIMILVQISLKLRFLQRLKDDWLKMLLKSTNRINLSWKTLFKIWRPQKILHKVIKESSVSLQCGRPNGLDEISQQSRLQFLRESVGWNKNDIHRLFRPELRFTVIYRCQQGILDCYSMKLMKSRATVGRYAKMFVRVTMFTWLAHWSTVYCNITIV